MFLFSNFTPISLYWSLHTACSQNHQYYFVFHFCSLIKLVGIIGLDTGLENSVSTHFQSVAYSLNFIFDRLVALSSHSCFFPICALLDRVYLIICLLCLDMKSYSFQIWFLFTCVLLIPYVHTNLLVYRKFSRIFCICNCCCLYAQIILREKCMYWYENVCVNGGILKCVKWAKG